MPSEHSTHSSQFERIPNWQRFEPSFSTDLDSIVSELTLVSDESNQVTGGLLNNDINDTATDASFLTETTYHPEGIFERNVLYQSPGTSISSIMTLVEEELVFHTRFTLPSLLEDEHSQENFARSQIVPNDEVARINESVDSWIASNAINGAQGYSDQHELVPINVDEFIYNVSEDNSTNTSNDVDIGSDLTTAEQEVIQIFINNDYSRIRNVESYLFEETGGLPGLKNWNRFIEKVLNKKYIEEYLKSIDSVIFQTNDEINGSGDKLENEIETGLSYNLLSNSVWNNARTETVITIIELEYESGVISTDETIDVVYHYEEGYQVNAGIITTIAEIELDSSEYAEYQADEEPNHDTDTESTVSDLEIEVTFTPENISFWGFDESDDEDSDEFECDICFSIYCPCGRNRRYNNSISSLIELSQSRLTI